MIWTPRCAALVLSAGVVAGVLGCKRAKPGADAGDAGTAGPAAWSVVAEAVAEDGTLSDQAVLKAFALTVAPLPGVVVPPVDASVPRCGSAALREAIARKDKLPPAQRDAIQKVLDGDGAPSPTRNAVHFEGPTAERYRPEIESIQAWLARFLGRPPLELRVEYTPVLPRGATGAEVFASARPLCPRRAGAAPQNRADYRDATDTEDTSGCICLVRVSRAADQRSADGMREILLHELTHCHQYKVQRGFPAAYVNEGHAMWVQSREHVEAGRGRADSILGGAWEHYFMGTGQGKLALAASPHAGGFALFQAIHNEGYDMRARGLGFMHAGNGFAELSSASPPAAAAWASQSLNESHLGPPWRPTGPEWIEHVHRAPALLGTVRRGAPKQVSIPTAAQQVVHAEIADADVLEIDVTAGFGRASFASPGQRQLSAVGAEVGWTGPANHLFCLKAEGCNVGYPLPVGNPRNGILVAATGGPSGAARVSLVGLSEQEARDRSTCVYGRWKYDDASALARTVAHVPPPTRVRSVTVDDVMELTRAGAYREDVRGAKVILETGGGPVASTITGYHTGRFTLSGNRLISSGLQQHLSSETAIQIGGRWVRTPMTIPEAMAIGSALGGQPVPGTPSSSSVAFRCVNNELFLYGAAGVNRYTRL